MLLRDDRQTALNQVETACLESADGYRHALQQTHDPILREIFGEALHQREQFALALAPHIRALGDLPRQPDPDRETLGHMVDDIRTFFALDEDANLAAQRLKADSELELALQAALQQALPEETRRLLREMLDAFVRTRDKLLHASE